MHLLSTEISSQQILFCLKEALELLISALHVFIRKVQAKIHIILEPKNMHLQSNFDLDRPMCVQMYMRLVWCCGFV